MLKRFWNGLERTRNRFWEHLRTLLGKPGRLTDADIEDLEEVLIGADFGVGLTFRLIEQIRSVEKAGSGGDWIAAARSVVLEELGPKPQMPTMQATPTVVFLVGVNGAGKTTTAAKLAWRYKNEGKAVLLAACDTFRAGAIEQLRVWRERLGISMVEGAYRADPASVLFEAIAKAREERSDMLIVDTAGRLHTKRNLMAELEKMVRVAGRAVPGAPHHTWLVLDANTGGNAIQQARQFHQSLGLTGLIVTKMDGTSKGGALVSIQKELGLPVLWIGLGEAFEDLEAFDPQQFAEALFPTMEKESVRDAAVD